MAFQFDALSREFLSSRLGKMLTEKDKANTKYHNENKPARLCIVSKRKI